jgi:hypothetical protein
VNDALAINLPRHAYKVLPSQLEQPAVDFFLLLEFCPHHGNSLVVPAYLRNSQVVWSSYGSGCLVGAGLDKFVKLVTPPIMLQLLLVLPFSLASSSFLCSQLAPFLFLQLLQPPHLFSLLSCNPSNLCLFHNGLFPGCLSF